MSTTGMEFPTKLEKGNIYTKDDILRLSNIPPIQHKKKAVLIYSGGLDSTTLLYKLISEEYEVFPLTINYGQKHKKEIEVAKSFVRNFGLEDRHKVIDISDIGQIIQSSLTSVDKDVPQVYDANTKKPATFTTLKSTVVPFRNAIFISIAVGYAESVGATDVFYAAHRSDRGMYPDCREEFVTSMELAAQIGTDNEKLFIHAPFVDYTKGNIVEVGAQLGIPYQRTWSCYVGKNKHCGKCSSCTERKIAFKDAGVLDPTEYEA